MIVLKSVKVKHGEVELKFEFSDGEKTRTVTIHEYDVAERLRVLKQLVGRELKPDDLKEIIVQVINEMRKGRKPLRQRFDYEDWIGVDLEATT